jgi:hypothetical protein
MPAPKRTKRAVITEFQREDNRTNLASKDLTVFPEANYSIQRGLSPKRLSGPVHHQ